MIPSVGRIVHYTLPHGPSAGQVRPAMIVRTWDANVVNLQVFMDGLNDGGPLAMWCTSVHIGQPGQPGTWFWPPKV